MRSNSLVLPVMALGVLFLASCSPRISGQVRLTEPSGAPVTGESPEGTVVNMINTSVPIEKASHSAVVDSRGNFTSTKGALKKGIFRVEVARIGYLTESFLLTLKSGTKMTLEVLLKKIPEGKRRSIESTGSDKDKIINPGEVNIQPPTL